MGVRRPADRGVAVETFAGTRLKLEGESIGFLNQPFAVKRSSSSILERVQCSADAQPHSPDGEGIFFIAAILCPRYTVYSR